MRSYRRFDPRHDLDSPISGPHDLNLGSRCSESTPIPIPRQTLCNAISLPACLRRLLRLYRCTLRPRYSPTKVPLSALVDPAVVFAPAVAAAFTYCALGMEVGILVERDGPGGVFGAENVATVSAVVAALEKGEVFGADGRVADGGVGVGFPV